MLGVLKTVLNAVGTEDPAAIVARRRAVVAAATAAIRETEVLFPIEHHLHAGLYVRTIEIPPNGVCTNAVIKIPTVVIVSGTLFASSGEPGSEPDEISGYNVILAEAPRQGIFFSPTGATVSMLFATNAKTLEEAEAEFTDDADQLQTRRL